MPLPAIDLWMRFVPGTPLKQNKKTRFPETPRGKLIAELIPRLPRGVKGKMYTVYSAVSPGGAPHGRQIVRGGPGGDGRSCRRDPEAWIRLRRHQHGVPGPKGHGGWSRGGPSLPPPPCGKDREGGRRRRGDSRHGEDPFGLRHGAGLVPRGGAGGVRCRGSG